MNLEIKDIISRQIIDSRGIPTIETDVILNNDIKGRASVPSGASTGKFEAVELRDNDTNNYFGKSVFKAINNVEKIIKPLLIGKNPFNQSEIDYLIIERDGSGNKSKLGANAILSVSIAIARACANSQNLPLYKYLGGIYGITMPVPMMNIINGGAHSNNKLDFQEFMIQPVIACNIKERIKMGVEVFHSLKILLNKEGYSTSVGDEGGFAPDFHTNTEALDIITEAIKHAGYTTDEIKICLDIAASELFKNGKYILTGEKKEFTTNEMINYIESLINRYPIISIEDGLNEEDYNGWQILTERLGEQCQLVGDDLFVTNYLKLENGIKTKMANAVLIKPNQCGSVTETMNTIQLAQKNNYKTIISHRSGETEDTFIADLSVAVNSGQIKTGSLSRGERIAKYNRLIRIEEEIN